MRWSRKLIPPEELVNFPPETLDSMALLAGVVGQIVGFASGEVRSTVGEVQLSNALPGHRADKPPSPASRVEHGGGHGDGELYRLSIHGLSPSRLLRCMRRQPTV